MNDKEQLIALCEKLNLKRSDDPDHRFYEDAYVVCNNEIWGDSIILGSGDGYGGFFVHFTFDPQGNLLKHGVGE